MFGRGLGWFFWVAALGLCPEARATDDLSELVAQLSSGPPAAQNRAIERLRYLGPGKSGPPLRALLQSGDVDLRIRGSAALAVVADPAAGVLLERGLGDEDWEVRRNCADALRAIRRKPAVSALSRCVQGDAHARVRLACARALPACGGGGRALAVAAVRDRELDVRLVALDGLARLMDRGAAAGVRPLLRDPVPLVTFAAARALAWSGDDAGRLFLAEAVASKDGDRQRRAITALSDCPKGWVPGVLASALEAQEVSMAAAEALARRSDARGLRWLAVRASGGEADAVSASRLLDELGVKEARRAELAAGAP
jgi:HEAT repeat protein